MPEKVGRDSARKSSKAMIKVRKTVLLIVNSDDIDIALFVKIKDFRTHLEATRSSSPGTGLGG